MKRFRWMVTYLVSLGLVLVAITTVSWAKNPDVAPRISITSPQDGAKVYEDSLNVVVRFAARTKYKKEDPRGNVRTIKLKLDGNLVATHDNPAQIKEGSYTFKLDVANLSDGDHALQAFAYQAEERAMLEGSSGVITFTFISVSRKITKIEKLCEKYDNLEAFQGNRQYAELAYELNKIGKTATPQLLGVVKDKTKDWKFRFLCVDRLCFINDEASIEPLARILKDTDDDVRIRTNIAEVFGKMGNKKAVEPLLTVLQDHNEDKSVRAGAVRGLSSGRLATQSAIEPLIQILDEEKGDTNFSRDIVFALEITGRITSDERATEALIEVVNDSNSPVRFDAISSLGRLKEESAVEPLINILQNKELHEFTRSATAQALGEIGTVMDDKTPVLDALIKALKDEEGLVRWSSAEALGKLGEERAIPPLEEAIAIEQSRSVKRIMTNALEALTGSK